MQKLNCSDYYALSFLENKKRILKEQNYTTSVYEINSSIIVFSMILFETCSVFPPFQALFLSQWRKGILDSVHYDYQGLSEVF